MKVTPDSTHRIVLTKQMREALSLKPGQPLEVSISAGALFLTPAPLPRGKVVKKGRLKVYAGKIPKIDVEEAIRKTREPRL